MPPLQGFLDGFQTQLTAGALATDTVLNFPTAGMVPGLQYHIRIDDSNPPTTFEYCVVQYSTPGQVNVVGGAAGRGIGTTAPAIHGSGPTSGFVTGIILRESLLPTFARLDTENLMGFASSSGISGQWFNAYGLPGAVQPSRYVGATTGGAPTTGAFLQGDFVLDTSNNVIWICTVAGSPGTWQNILDGTNTGLAGAVSSLTRLVGATGQAGPPQGLTVAQVGDVAIDRVTPTIWIKSGSSGTAVNAWRTAGPSQIDCAVIGTDPRYPTKTGTITFNPINTLGQFRHLLIELEGACDTAGTSQECGMRFNSDSGATYGYQREFATSTSVSASDQATVGQTSCRQWFLSGATALANAAGRARIWIPNYRGAFLKMAHIDNDWFQGTAFPTAGSMFAQDVIGFWNNNAAISRIDLIALANNFVVGTVATLYGIPGTIYGTNS